ncbi:MAG: MFS transporter [Spongiibacteraceae bacterium]
MEKNYSPGYSRYVLFILMLTYTCSYLDRYVLSVLIEPIKADLGVSDTQLGLLGGFAFALLYTVAGIPIARLADRGNRRTIIAVGVTAWSIMTVACGLVKNFPQLVLARVGVGLGEAACTPPSHSLIADYFPPEKRATALSIYIMAIPVGVMLGFLAGGWIAHFFDWRTAFIVVGAPGLILAVLVRYTIDEPQRGRLDKQARAQAEISLVEALRFVATNRALILIQIGGAFYALSGYGISFWIAPFFSRVHHLQLQELATWLAIGAFFGGIVGAYMAGRFADYAGRKGLHWYVLTPVIALILGLPLTVLMIFTDSPVLALCLFVMQQFVFSCYGGPIYAAMQFIVPAKMRALIVAIHLFILNLIGLGMGPLLIGIMNDAFTPHYGEAGAIRLSLLAVTLSSVVTLIAFTMAARLLQRDKIELAHMV